MGQSPVGLWMESRLKVRLDTCVKVESAVIGMEVNTRYRSEVQLG